MEKRLLLATFLSIAILILFQYLFVHKRELKYPPEQRKTINESKRYLPKATKEPLPRTIIEKGSDFTFETALTRIILTNHGGRIKAIYMKQYTDGENRPLNLLRKNHLEIFSPISIRFPDSDFSRLANDVIYNVQYQRLATSETRPNATISFFYEAPSGPKFYKIYTFNHNSYLIRAKILIENLPPDQRQNSYQLLWSGILIDDGANKYRSSYKGPLLYLNKNLVKAKMDDAEEPVRYKGTISWVGLESKYFLIALIPPEKVSTAIIEKSNGKDTSIMMGLEYLSEGSRIEKEITIYAGPKEVDRLEKVQANLEKAIDFGWFTFLATPLLKLLKYFYRYTNNYGVSIIILTIIIKIVFYPLSYKSYKSMKKMQEIQPKIKLIQERYKKDRQKLNQEMLALYREYRVNPLGGCLPMLLQIPVFFALYRVLLDAIELRKAPFIWWIKDLSDKDPYYIWPILMGLSMFVQQKMTPQVGDPRQNRIMMMMPLIFTVMFLNFPVGLVIYWLVNNILSIMQQYYLTQNAGKPKAA